MKESQHCASALHARILTVPAPVKNQQVTRADLRSAYIQFYSHEIRGAMLDRIVMFSLDPNFNSICHDLANDAGLKTCDAADHLWRLSSRIYTAAAGVPL